MKYTYDRQDVALLFDNVYHNYQPSFTQPCVCCDDPNNDKPDVITHVPSIHKKNEGE